MYAGNPHLHPSTTLLLIHDGEAPSLQWNRGLPYISPSPSPFHRLCPLLKPSARFTCESKNLANASLFDRFNPPEPP